MTRPIRLLTVWLALAGLSSAARPAAAVTIDFDALAPLSDAADAEQPGVTLGTNLVVDEEAAANVTGRRLANNKAAATRFAHLVRNRFINAVKVRSFPNEIQQGKIS